MTRSPLWRALATGLALTGALASAFVAPSPAHHPAGADKRAIEADSPPPPIVNPSDAPASDLARRNPPTVYEYADGLQLDAYVPQEANAPWIMYLHGGAWLEGDRDDALQWPLVWREAGFAVFSIDYHLAGQAAWPAQLTDVSNALDWIRGNAATLGIDPARGVLVGTSAGAHIALAAATAGADVRGVVAISPAVELYPLWDAAHHSRSKKVQRLADGALLLMGCSPYNTGSACWVKWMESSPRQQLSTGDAPILILHSRDDKILPSAPVGRFCGGAATKHVACKVLMYSGTRHGISLMRAKWNVILNWIITKTA